MNTLIQPLTLLVVAIAGWVQRDQQAAIVYLLEENRGYFRVNERFRSLESTRGRLPLELWKVVSGEEPGEELSSEC